VKEKEKEIPSTVVKKTISTPELPRKKKYKF